MNKQVLREVCANIFQQDLDLDSREIFQTSHIALVDAISSLPTPLGTCDPSCQMVSRAQDSKCLRGLTKCTGSAHRGAAKDRFDTAAIGQMVPLRNNAQTRTRRPQKHGNQEVPPRPKDMYRRSRRVDTNGIREREY